jgi:hypothetical protein
VLVDPLAVSITTLQSSFSVSLQYTKTAGAFLQVIFTLFKIILTSPTMLFALTEI